MLKIIGTIGRFLGLVPPQKTDPKIEIPKEESLADYVKRIRPRIDAELALRVSRTPGSFR